MGKKQIILGVTGSIAAYKSADIIRKLKEHELVVSVIMTESAERFITPLTLATLSEEKAHRELFDEGKFDNSIDHIRLAKEADLILVAPATANIIGKVANGLADDLLTCTIMASKAPIIFAPAMNDGMYSNKFFQQNYKKLKEAGYSFIDPIEGSLACGTYGEGHIAEVEAIVKAVLARLKKKS